MIDSSVWEYLNIGFAPPKTVILLEKMLINDNHQILIPPMFWDIPFDTNSGHQQMTPK